MFLLVSQLFNWFFDHLFPPTRQSTQRRQSTLTLWLRPSDEGTDPKLKKLSSFGGLELQLRKLAKKNLTDMGGSKNSGKHPKSSHGLIIRVFHYFHHPFLGETLSLFLGNTHHGSRGKKKNGWMLGGGCGWCVSRTKTGIFWHTRFFGENFIGPSCETNDLYS